MLKSISFGLFLYTQRYTHTTRNVTIHYFRHYFSFLYEYAYLFFPRCYCCFKQLLLSIGNYYSLSRKNKRICDLASVHKIICEFVKLFLVVFTFLFFFAFLTPNSSNSLRVLESHRVFLPMLMFICSCT